MQDSQQPPKIPLPWASSAGPSYITDPVPTPSQIGITNGAASFTDGFPPNCFVPYASGGAGPFGKDFNGLLKQATGGIQWQQAGGAVLNYDGAFQTVIGGYPSGALVWSLTTYGKIWRSITDNNVTDPDTGGGGWATWAPGGLLGIHYFTSTDTYTPITGTRTAYIRLWAPGGGGGGSNDVGDAGVAGSGGEYREGLFSIVTSSYAVTLAAGGTAGTAGGGTGGTPGAASVAGLVACNSGVGGIGSNGSGIVQIANPGGTGGTGGSLAMAGQFGGFAIVLAGGPFGTSTSLQKGIGGGAFSSPWTPVGISNGLNAADGSTSPYPGCGGESGVNGGAGGAGSFGLCQIFDLG